MTKKKYPIHEVEVSDFDNYILYDSLCSSYGDGESKSLDVKIDIENMIKTFIVKDHGVPIIITEDLSKAVDFYNNPRG